MHAVGFCCRFVLWLASDAVDALGDAVDALKAFDWPQRYAVDDLIGGLARHQIIQN